MQETEQAPEREPADIFLWANNADAYKNELDVEIFLLEVYPLYCFFGLM